MSTPRWRRRTIECFTYTERSTALRLVISEYGGGVGCHEPHRPPRLVSSVFTRASKSAMCFSKAAASFGSVTAMMGSLRAATSSFRIHRMNRQQFISDDAQEQIEKIVPMWMYVRKTQCTEVEQTNRHEQSEVTRVARIPGTRKD